MDPNWCDTVNGKDFVLIRSDVGDAHGSLSTAESFMWAPEMRLFGVECLADRAANL